MVFTQNKYTKLYKVLHQMLLVMLHLQANMLMQTNFWDR